MRGGVPDARSYRVTQDRSGRWHVAFAAVADLIPAPGRGAVVGVEDGVAASAVVSSGDLLHCPGGRPKEAERLVRLKRRRAKAQRGSTRRARLRAQIARLQARAADRRKDWVEKTSTEWAGRFDVIRVEDLTISGMTTSARGSLEAPGANVRAKAGLNRAILANGWGLLVRRLEDKASGRVEKVNPVFTSRTCTVMSAGRWIGRRARAKPSSVAGPAGGRETPL